MDIDNIIDYIAVPAVAIASAVAFVKMLLTNDNVSILALNNEDTIQPRQEVISSDNIVMINKASPSKKIIKSTSKLKEDMAVCTPLVSLSICCRRK